MLSGICHLPCIPMRAAPDSRSEQVSQLLMGETYQVLESGKDWYLIRTTFDNYEGWINNTQYWQARLPIPDSDFFLDRSFCALDGTVLSMGAELTTGEAGYALRHNEQIQLELDARIDKPGIVSLAEEFLGAPYLWGGRTIMGIDCSGLVQVVFKALGKALPRDSRDQAFIGDGVAFLQEAQAGDLAFFDNEEGHITHVGILTCPEEIIHAHGKVRKDKIDGQGIFNSDTQKYSHKLRLIKRIR